MKNNNLRNLALIALILFSLASYIYVNTAVIAEDSTAEQSIQLEKEKEQGNNEIMLPDVKAVKAVIEKGRQLLPAS